MNEIRKFINQTIVYGFSSVIARVLNFLLVPLYTHPNYGIIPSDFAVVSELYAYAAFLMVIGSFGMETAFFRFARNDYGKQKFSAKTVFSTAFIFLLINALLFTCLSLVFYRDIALWIGQSDNSIYVLFFIAIIGFDLVSTIPFAVLRYKNKAVRFATFKTINILINIFCNVFFLLICPLWELQNHDLIACVYDVEKSKVYYIFISNLIASVFTLLLLFTEIKNNIIWPKYLLWKKMATYSWPIAIAGFAYIINESSDKVLLRPLLELSMPSSEASEQLGIYSACYKLTIFMTLFVQAYRFAAEPFFFNQFKRPNSKKTYSLMMDVFVLFSLIIFMFVTLNLEFITNIFIINTNYHGGIEIVPIVLIANIFLGMYYNLSVWYKVTNLTKYAAIISTVGAAITIMANIILIPIYESYLVAAWTTLFCYLIMLIISFFLGQKHFKIKYNLTYIFGHFIFAFSIWFISKFFDHSLYYKIQIDNTLLFLLYSIFIFWHIKRILKKPVNIYGNQNNK